jgi:hypothetical protein
LGLAASFGGDFLVVSPVVSLLFLISSRKSPFNDSEELALMINRLRDGRTFISVNGRPNGHG